MPSTAVDTAIKTKLASGWTTSVVVGGFAAGDPPDPITEPPEGVDRFLVVQYPVVNNEKPVIHGKYFEEGAVRLVLNVSRNYPIATALPWADSLATLFREIPLNSIVSGFQTFVPSTPVVNDAIDEGNWNEFSVIVPYRYQHS